MTDYYPLDEVGTTFRCRGCMESQTVDAQPAWRFQLNSAVAKGIENNQHVTILALARLQSEAEYSFLWCPESRVYANDIDQDGRDIDLLVVSDGQLMIGECTRSRKLAEADFGKMEAVAEHLNARWILFATTAAWITRGSWDRVFQLMEDLKDKNVEVDVLVQRDLFIGRMGEKQRAIREERARREVARKEKTRRNTKENPSPEQTT